MRPTPCAAERSTPARVSRALLAGISLILASLAATPPPPAMAQAPAALSKDEFLSSAGAIAFRAKDYPAAIQGFRALLSRYPDTPLLYRYLGLSHYRLRQFSAAAGWYDRGLRRAPRDVSLLFFSAQNLFAAGDERSALRRLLLVARLAPESAYGQRARRVLAQRADDLKALAAERRKPSGRDRWSAVARLGVAYDDNVAAQPDSFTGDADAFRIFQQLSGRYTLLQGARLGLTADGSGYLSQHTDNFDELNLGSLDAGLTARLRGTLLGAPSALALRYGFDVDYLDADLFSQAHALSARYAVAPRDWVTLSAEYRASFKDFDFDGFDPSIASRDAVTQRVSPQATFYFDDRQVALTLRYAFEDNAARGDNFDYRQHGGDVSLSVELPAGFRLDGSAGYAHTEYDAFRGPVARQTERLDLSVGLERRFDHGLTARLGYRYLLEDSSIEVLEYDRHLASFSLSKRF
ncbi:MAG: DUF2860 family protein [Pseudomonadota bacterium]